MVGGISEVEDRSNTKVALGLSIIIGNRADPAVGLPDHYSILCSRTV